MARHDAISSPAAAAVLGWTLTGVGIAQNLAVPSPKRVAAETRADPKALAEQERPGVIDGIHRAGRKIRSAAGGPRQTVPSDISTGQVSADRYDPSDPQVAVKGRNGVFFLDMPITSRLFCFHPQKLLSIQLGS